MLRDQGEKLVSEFRLVSGDVIDLIRRVYYILSNYVADLMAVVCACDLKTSRDELKRQCRAVPSECRWIGQFAAVHSSTGLFAVWVAGIIKTRNKVDHFACGRVTFVWRALFKKSR